MAWIPVEISKPMGNCMVVLSKPMCGLYIHTASFKPSANGAIIGVVGGVFDFDISGKITHWSILPSMPKKGDVQDSTL